MFLQKPEITTTIETFDGLTHVGLVLDGLSCAIAEMSDGDSLTEGEIFTAFALLSRCSDVVKACGQELFDYYRASKGLPKKHL